jgi:hypothetical protein
MTEYTPSLEFENELRAAVSVPNASDEFVNALRKELTARAATMTKPSTRRLRPAWVIPLACVLIMVVVTLVIGPQRVWAAVRSLFGYLPGVGYVETDGSLRVLTEPVMMEREGVTLTVEQAVVDSQRTIIIFKVEGLSVQAANSQGEGGPSGSIPYLRLPDGTQLDLLSGGGSGWGIGYEMRSIFPAIPMDVNEVFFVVPVLQDMPPGTAPEGWELLLHFKPAPPDLTLQPVYEADETSPVSETQVSSETPAPPTKSEAHGVTFSLERIVDLEDGYILQGDISWAGLAETRWLDFYEIDLSDANGQQIPAERITPDAEYNPSVYEPWAVQTSSKAYAAPWVISLSSVGLHVMTDVELQIDLGSEPQLGQVWDYDQEIEVAGHKVRLISVSLYQDQDGRIWLEFSFSENSGIYGIDLWDPDNLTERGSGKVYSDNQGVVISAFTYDDIPTGVRDIHITGISYTQEDPWQISWNPPEETNPTSSTPTPLPQVCLTLDMWERFRSQPQAALPDGLSGRFLILTHTGLMLPRISLIDLDGENRKDFGTGAWISLSQDGKTIAIPKDDGVYLADVDTGDLSFLVGTNQDSGDPIWSPDGEWIAFHSWNAQSIYRLRIDGAGLERVYQGADVVYLSDWTPDGRKIIYLGFGEGGMVIQGIDLETGIREVILQTGVIKPTSRPAISPDGKWIAYQDEVFGQDSNGIFIAYLGGSVRISLVAIDADVGVSVGAWSPDGQWLVVNVYDMGVDTINATPVLIQPSTCNVFPLLSLQGEVVGWVPED